MSGSRSFRSDGAYNHTYNYDSFGNLLPHDNVYTTPNYSIDPATNRLLLNNTDLHYLPNGWMDASPGHSYWWTAEGNLRSVDAYQTGSYLYNAQGQRTLAVRLENNPNYEAAEYVYFNGQPMADYSRSAKTGWDWQYTDNIYAGGQRIARISNSMGTGATANQTHYYLNDNLGTMQMELNADGTTAWQGQFTPFGQEIVNGTPLLSWTPDGSSNRYKFTGKERDTESGLDYFGARYYASSMGRFMTPDPLNLTDERLLNPSNTLNKYAYAANNPLKYVDPDGKDITYFYDQGGVAGHAVLFAYNQQTGDSAIESFGPNHHAPADFGHSMYEMDSFKSAQDVREKFASLTIQTSPELAQEVIDYIRANPDPALWTAIGPNCSTQVWKILQKFKLAHEHGTDNKKDPGAFPSGIWRNLTAQYNPNAPQNPKNGTDYGKPRTDMFNALWLSLPQAPKDNSTVTTQQCDHLPDGKTQCR